MAHTKRRKEMKRTGFKPIGDKPIGGGTGLNVTALYTVIAVAVAVAVTSFGLGLSAYIASQGGRSPKFSNSTFVVFVNSDTGDDRYNGEAKETPVKTLLRALRVFYDRSGRECIIQLHGSLPHNLGANTRLDFYPLVSYCQTIIVRGERNVVSNGTVQSVIVHGPKDNWRGIGIVETISGSPRFVQNIDQNRTFVIHSSTLSSILSIAGDTFVKTVAVIPYNYSSPLIFGQSQNAWSVGEQYVAYNLKTRLTFTGGLHLDIPFGEVVFQDIQITGNTWHNPTGLPHKVVMTGCQFDVMQTIQDQDSSMYGSVMLQGVFVNGSGVEHSHFNRFEPNTCLSSESLFIHKSDISYMGSSCHSFFTYGQNMSNKINVYNANFYGFGIFLDSVRSYAMIEARGSVVTVIGSVLDQQENFTALPGLIHGLPFGLLIGSHSRANIENTTITMRSHIFSIGIYIHQSELIMGNGMNISTTNNACVKISGSGIMHVYGGPFVNSFSTSLYYAFIVVDRSTLFIDGFHDTSAALKLQHNITSKHGILVFGSSSAHMTGSPIQYNITLDGYMFYVESSSEASVRFAGALGVNVANITLPLIFCGVANETTTLVTTHDYTLPNTRLCKVFIG